MLDDIHKAVPLLMTLAFMILIPTMFVQSFLIPAIATEKKQIMLGRRLPLGIVPFTMLTSGDTNTCVSPMAAAPAAALIEKPTRYLSLI